MLLLTHESFKNVVTEVNYCTPHILSLYVYLLYSIILSIRNASLIDMKLSLCIEMKLLTLESFENHVKATSITLVFYSADVTFYAHIECVGHEQFNTKQLRLQLTATIRKPFSRVCTRKYTHTQNIFLAIRPNNSIFHLHCYMIESYIEI